MLTIQEFELLKYLYNNKKSVTQRALASEIGVSLGTMNGLIKSLFSKRLIDIADNGYKVIRGGIDELNNYRVDNAIIMAAGMSSRFAPLSYEKPKGLLKVKGEILIEREINQLKEAGINDITVVVGYMKEQFFYLEEKFGVKIVVNEDYYKYNNTSTLIRVIDRLSNTYICSSDNYFVDNVFEKYVYRSYYSAVYAEGKTDEYCLFVDNSGRINKVTIGGSDSWCMLGHVYFDRNFSKKFSQILQREYDNSETREKLWENLYIRYIKELDLYIKKYDSNKVLEFDSLDELRYFDEEYINNADSKILKNICRVLSCEMHDIKDIVAINAGLTNTSFRFCVDGEKYVYRHPGIGTERYINRKSEAVAMDIAKKIGLDDTYIYMDPVEGFKISKYVDNAKELDYGNEDEVKNAIAMFKKLHEQNITTDYDFGIWNKTTNFINTLNNIGKLDFAEFDSMYSILKKVNNYVLNDGFSRHILCHNDCYSPNFIIDENGKMFLIDWEYAGNDDPASDLGTFICCSGYDYEQALNVIKIYDKEVLCNKGKLAHYIGYVAMTSFYWYVWALFQESRGNAVGEWLYIWYKNSLLYGKKTLELLEEINEND